MASVGGVSIVDPEPEPFDLGFGPGRRSVREHVHDVVEADRAFAGREDRGDVHVVDVVVPGAEDVAGIAADADVRDVGVVREPVERRVGLDEAAMGLRVEVGADRREVAGQHVEPR